LAEWKCTEGLNDPKVVMEANSYWTDIVKIDSFQVMDIKDAMELMQRK
jgi:hypothetical protein